MRDYSRRILQFLADQVSGPQPRILRRFDRKPKRLAWRRLFLLQGLPGVGPALANRLLCHFGSVERILTVDAPSLAGIRGIGAKKAARIRELVAERSCLAHESGHAVLAVDNEAGCSHHDHMRRGATVGVRELKTRLGGYLQQVRQGRTLVITDRGEPVAELKPLGGAIGEDARLEQLKALGAVTRLENRPLAPFRPVRGVGRSVSDAIIEDRNDRA